jgi:hypothetical protein
VILRGGSLREAAQSEEAALFARSDRRLIERSGGPNKEVVTAFAAS